MKKWLKFGVATVQDLPWPKMIENCQWIESLGFDSIWVPDHFVNPHLIEEDWFDSWTLLAALACKTSSIRLGTLVTNIIYRNPAVLAKQASTLDHISGGRLNLGIGATSKGDPSHAMTGVEVWDTGERVQRFREFIEIVDLLLRNEIGSYQGRFYTIKEARMKPHSLQKPRPPLTIAAMGPTTLKYAARVADTWNTYGGWNLSPQQTVDILRQGNEMIDGYCAELGRNPGEITRSFLMGLTQDTPFASSNAFQDFIHRLVEVGMTEFIFYYDYPPIPEDKRPTPQMLQKLAEQVIPAIKAEYSS